MRVCAQYIFERSNNHNTYRPDTKQLIVPSAYRPFDRSPNVRPNYSFTFLNIACSQNLS
jgi:hypothetical protein